MHPTEATTITAPDVRRSDAAQSSRSPKQMRDGAAGEGSPTPGIVWIPVAIGAGIVVYFTLKMEPPPWIGPAAGTILAGLAIGAVKITATRLAGWLAAFCAATIGFSAASLATVLAATPMLMRPLDPVGVEGRVVAVETLPAGKRLTLDQLVIEDLSTETTPARVRIRVPKSSEAEPGDRVRMLAGLQPPSEPAMPGAFDFRRQAFFVGLGAVGFAYGQPAVQGSASKPVPDFAEVLREKIAARIRGTLDGDEAELAIALTTGERSALSAMAVDAMRASGLAHLLAISGLHVGLVAGLVFGVVRLALAVHPWTALKLPTKAISALAALVATLAYVWLIGAPIPTRRAAIMTGLALVAVAIGRQAFSLRLIAVAATAVMLLTPESVLGPSFQLSFGAVLALIVVARHLSDRPVVRPGGGTVWWRMRRSLGSALAATLAATAATTPIALYHFQQFPVWGVAANLVAIPLNGLAIMPAVVASFVLMPLGLEAPALWCLGKAVAALLWIATSVAQWPGAVLRLPAMPDWGYVLVAAGGICLCLTKGKGRVVGLIALAIGTLSLSIGGRPPDILVAASGRLFAVIGDDEVLSPSTRRSEQFSLEVWESRTGRDAGPSWPIDGSTRPPQVRCDPDACLWGRGGLTIAFVYTPDGLEEECLRAEIIVTSLTVPRSCSFPRLIIDRRRLSEEGAHAIWIEGSDWTIETVAETVGDRPWSAYRQRSTAARR